MQDLACLVGVERLGRVVVPATDDEEPGESSAADDSSAKWDGAITCARCYEELEYAGTRKFHEGTNWGLLGAVGELFVNKEAFDIYLCKRCGSVEFFLEGVGEKYRRR